MPNIILTEYCNLKCPYCFASKMIEDAKENDFNKNITEEQLLFILKWLKPTAISRDYSIGLIGGEPTLHPNFSKILEIVNSYNQETETNSIIFTNGILLKQYLHQIGEKMSMLININKITNKNTLNKLLDTLDEINTLNWFEIQKVTLGCNLYLQETDYSFFWNIVDRYRNIKKVRMSVTAPNNPELKKNKELYYNQMKPIFLEFLTECKKREIIISYDCNQIPLCFFSESEKNLINSLGERNEYCDPVIDITPDFKATCCFGVYTTPIDCTNFENVDILNKYFQSKILEKTVHNNNSLCATCGKTEWLQCQGGCLSFSNI